MRVTLCGMPPRLPSGSKAAPWGSRRLVVLVVPDAATSWLFREDFDAGREAAQHMGYQGHTPQGHLLGFVATGEFVPHPTYDAVGERWTYDPKAARARA